MDNLLPCPFCGHAAEICGDDHMWWYVNCTYCDCSMGYQPDDRGWKAGDFSSKPRAIAAWNTREVGVLVAALNRIIETDDAGDYLYRADGPCARIARDALAATQGNL